MTERPVRCAKCGDVIPNMTWDTETDASPEMLCVPCGKSYRIENGEFIDTYAERLARLETAANARRFDELGLDMNAVITVYCDAHEDDEHEIALVTEDDVWMYRFAYGAYTAHLGDWLDGIRNIGPGSLPFHGHCGTCGEETHIEGPEGIVRPPQRMAAVAEAEDPLGEAPADLREVVREDDGTLGVRDTWPRQLAAEQRRVVADIARDLYRIGDQTITAEQAAQVTEGTFVTIPAVPNTLTEDAFRDMADRITNG